MINMTKLGAGLLTCAVLVGCGGGSTTGNDDTPAFGRADPKIEFFPQKPSLLSNRSGFPVDQTAPYFTQVNIKITDDNYGSLWTYTVAVWPYTDSRRSILD